MKYTIEQFNDLVAEYENFGRDGESIKDFNDSQFSVLAQAASAGRHEENKHPAKDENGDYIEEYSQDWYDAVAQYLDDFNKASN